LNLGKLRINVVEKPGYKQMENFMIDESALESVLTEEMNYKNNSTLRKDVDSISAVMRLRKGQQSHFIEDCGAIFVTPNRSLVGSVQRFFQRENLQGIFPCITDYSLTNLLWLKKPTAAPDLPIKRIVADSFAAMQPSDLLWAKYMDALEKQTAAGELSQEEYLLARSHFAVKDTLMDVTLGDEKAFTKGTEREIVRLIEKRMIGEKDEEIEKLKNAAVANENQIRDQHSQALDTERKRVAEATQRAAQAEERETQRNAGIHQRAQRIARIAVRGSTALIALIAVVLNVIYNPSPDAPVWAKYGGYGIGIVLGIPLVIELFFDKNITYVFRKLESFLSSRIERYMHRILS
jgi:hypothetical protein